MNVEKIKSINNCELCERKTCLIGCPLDNDIPEVIKNIKKEKYKEAFEIFTRTTVLMPICGRVCPYSKQCEGGCIKRRSKKKVKIGKIEAFIGDLALDNNWSIDVSEKTKYNVAVIGSGPSSLTCAAFLRRNGVGVTIFEKYDYLGGLLVHGIPEFRLPKEIVNNVINKIIDMGIEVKYNNTLGKNLSLELLKEQYDAIYLGVGANVSNKMHIPGEKLNGVYGANEYLEKKYEIDFTDRTVVVCGGGDVAIDVARTVKKSGASKVYIVYRKEEKLMPADLTQIKLAKKDGIEFLFAKNIIKIMGRKRVNKVELINTIVENKENESIITNVEGSESYLPCNYVFMALGSHTDNNVKKLFLDIDKKGKIIIDKNGQTSDKMVFAGGDVTNTKGTVAWAARSGRNAAYAIIDYLNNK
jgi:glutamate synthase (NADPH/NADH) small chain